jgi:hypothetical protein
MKSSLQLARFKPAKIIPKFIPFAGGLDLETPPLFMQPGLCREAQNYEHAINGGYARIQGYERFDGRPAPSDANYAVLEVTISGEFEVGDAITGVDSSATAVVVAVVTDVTPNYLVITKIVGDFDNGEVLNVSASPEGTTSSLATVDGASSRLLHAQYKNLAADEHRDDITAVPGSGNLLGGFRFGGVTYALRNNAGGTAAVLHKSTSSGWATVALGRELAFTSGSTEIVEGNTITGATSMATAVVTRVMLESGSWGAGTAAGRLIFASQTGTFQAEDLDVGASLNVATIAADSSAITLQPGGRLEAVKANFGGSVNTVRIYGVDGVNRGFEFDGTVYCPIDTGMTTDAPTHVAAHRNHLFFSFGGSVQHSAPGTPYIWSVVLGAAEIAMGDTVTGFKSQPGSETSGAMAIFTRNRTSILYGTGVSDWVLASYRDDMGAYEHTIQDVAHTIFLDDLGITNFQTAQEYGNFSHSALSARIKTWLNLQRTKATASCVVRDKNQYRLFFSDQYGVFVTMSGHKVVGMMPVFFAHPVRCAWSEEESDGSETVWFGSTNGMVYQMEKGTSFDGDAIEHYLNLVFNFFDAPGVLKGFKGCALEVTGEGYAEFGFTYELDYADSDSGSPGTQTSTISLSAGNWDDGGAWDVLFWDGRSLAPAVVDMEGSAENVSIILGGSSDYHSAIRFSGARVNYMIRRLTH